MDIKLTPGATEDKELLDDEEWESIRKKIEDIGPELSNEDLKLVPNPLLDHPIWQLNHEMEDQDYRVFLDVDDGSIVILGIFSFEFTHQGDEHWRELRERE